MDLRPAYVIRWLFDSESGASDRLIPRWIFLRGLGLIYYSAFLSLVFQIRGLIGPHGILPAGEYLQEVANSTGHGRFWYAPSLFWFSNGSHAVVAVCWIGMLASLLLVLNLWPRGMLVVCFACFLSFVSAAGEFSGYQSDGMLLEAGFLSLFFAPPGLRPGWGQARPPSRASLYLLLWECFRIYFGSGIAKLASGDPQWRHFTAMDEYYQNGPLPTWIGWYAEQLPHWFHAATAFGTLALELAVIWMMFLPRRWRMACFFVFTPWQIGIILTANYTFLNYLVLLLGFLLLDDRFLKRFLPQHWKRTFSIPLEELSSASEKAGFPNWWQRWRPARNASSVAGSAVMLTWLFYASTVPLVWMIRPGIPFPTTPIVALEPFRIADRYGLFAVMTRGRYEIEFQGSADGQTWLIYPFRFKPQDPRKPPGIYAPYQPRFDWNLWFASLGPWRADPIVLRTEERLLTGNQDVLLLFAGNPFPNAPPKQVRAVLWQYWFTTIAEKRTLGVWWRREQLGLYAPALELAPDGKLVVLEWPTASAPRD